MLSSRRYAVMPRPCWWWTKSPPAKAARNPEIGERGELRARGADAVGLCRPLVLAHADQNATGSTSPQALHRANCQQQHDERRGNSNAGLAVDGDPAEQRGPFDSTSRQPVHEFGVEEPTRVGQGEGQGGHREEQSLDAQCREADGHGRRAPAIPAPMSARLRSHPACRGQIAGDRRADGQEGDLAEAHLSGPPGQHHE